ncbi:PH domain-containing protein [Shewanella gaetbuli]|uniref:PH domain-containing protein n=1 Tax=Shewanella gaetbuli TaxID=220752 RepID=A0A9X2CKR2_9GAMM|nr:PH domain-containing protein [Shewanella gaetbuli]MCL1141889.1 PH domain-containing protein [Shewanella gaetbuli]
MTEQSPSPELELEATWQALSPWSIISFVASVFKAMLSNAYALIPIFYAGWSNDIPLLWVIEGGLLLLVLLSLFAFLQWTKFRFRISASQLDVKQGILFTKTDEIPLSRIQNIRYEQPFYFRPLDLATLVIETAGSSKDEAKLAALDAKQAQTLKLQLLQLSSAKEQTTADNIPQRSTIDNHQPIIKRSLGDLILFGLYQNNFIWFAIIAGPVMGQIEWEKVAESAVIQSIFDWAIQVTHNNIILQTSLFMSLIVIGYIVFSMISILASVLKYHPYSLDKRQQTLQRSGGVIAHQQDALAIKRIQLIHFHQPLLARILKIWTIYLKQVKGSEIEQKTQKHMLIPSVRPAEISSLFQKLPSLNQDEITLPNEYHPIHIDWFYKRVWLPFMPFVLLLIGWLTTAVDKELLVVSFVAAMLGAGLLFLRFKQWGYVIEKHAIWQRTGLLGADWKRIPFDKIQHVTLTQTASQKKQQLAYVQLGLASGLINIPYIELSVANKITARSLNAVAKQYKQWI